MGSFKHKVVPNPSVGPLWPEVTDATIVISVAVLAYLLFSIW